MLTNLFTIIQSRSISIYDKDAIKYRNISEILNCISVIREIITLNKFIATLTSVPEPGKHNTKPVHYLSSCTPKQVHSIVCLMLTEH